MNINPSGNRSNYTIPRQDMKYSPVKCSLALTGKMTSVSL